jgi:plasmid maintenance system antidote protein VapI
MKTAQRLKPNKPIIAPRVKELLQTKLDELNINAHELAAQMDAAYDHIRVIVKGEKFAGKLMVQEIARRLGINNDVIMTAWRSDKAEKAGHKIPPMEPGLARLVNLYSQLPEHVQEEIVKFAAFQKSNTEFRAVQ